MLLTEKDFKSSAPLLAEHSVVQSTCFLTYKHIQGLVLYRPEDQLKPLGLQQLRIPSTVRWGPVEESCSTWALLLHVIHRIVLLRILLQPGRLTGVSVKGWDPSVAAHTALYLGRQNQSTVKLTTVNSAENWADAEAV